MVIFSIHKVHFGFCEWRSNFFRLQTHLHTSISRFPARYWSIECASTQIFDAKTCSSRYGPRKSGGKSENRQISLIYLGFSFRLAFADFGFTSIGCKLMFDSKRPCTARCFVSLHFMGRLSKLAGRFDTNIRENKT